MPKWWRPVPFVNRKSEWSRKMNKPSSMWRANILLKNSRSASLASHVDNSQRCSGARSRKSGSNMNIVYCVKSSHSQYIFLKKIRLRKTNRLKLLTNSWWWRHKTSFLFLGNFWTNRPIFTKITKGKIKTFHIKQPKPKVLISMLNDGFLVLNFSLG